eukprot:1628591-Rhodomonas_salina.1
MRGEFAGGLRKACAFDGAERNAARDAERARRASEDRQGLTRGDFVDAFVVDLSFHCRQCAMHAQKILLCVCCNVSDRSTPVKA